MPDQTSLTVVAAWCLADGRVYFFTFTDWDEAYDWYSSNPLAFSDEEYRGCQWRGVYQLENLPRALLLTTSLHGFKPELAYYIPTAAGGTVQVSAEVARALLGQFNCIVGWAPDQKIDLFNSPSLAVLIERAPFNPSKGPNL